MGFQLPSDMTAASNNATDQHPHQSIDEDEMIKYQSPRNEATSSQAPVQIINVPFNPLRAEGDFRPRQPVDDDFDVDVHAASRLKALSLKDGGGRPPKLAAGSTAATQSASQNVLPQVGPAQSPIPSANPSSVQYLSDTNNDGQSVTSVVTDNSRVRSSSATQVASSSRQQPGAPVDSSVVAGSGESVASTSSTIRSQREQFLIFIKILFKCLDQAGEPEVRDKAKKIVAECTRKNRLGDPAFAPLMGAVEKRLRGFVGEALWRRSLVLFHHYISKKGDGASRSCSSDSVASSDP